MKSSPQLFLSLLAICSFGMPNLSHADTTFVVNTTLDTADADSTDGICDDSQGKCSLRAAVMEITQSNSSDNFVIILPPGIYTLTRTGANEDSGVTGDLDITRSVHIVGFGSLETFINGASIDRIFHIIPDSPQPSSDITTVAISGVSLNSGFAGGAGTGGAILVPAGTRLYLSECSVSANIAVNKGGGVANFGTATIANCDISNNGATSAGGGLANASSAFMSVTNVRILSNSSEGGGGGIENEAGAEMTIVDSIIRSNDAFTTGGGIENIAGATLSIFNSAILQNTSSSHGGGIFHSSGGGLVLVNSTIADNVAQGSGGGVFGTSSDQGGFFIHTTIAGNTGATAGGVRGAAYNTSFVNTLIAENTGDNCANNFAPTSFGGNLDDDGTCAFAGTGDLVGIDPLIQVLQDIGGGVFIRPLSGGSPAIDAANQAFCTAEDQIGSTRLIDGDRDGTVACDIGAIERTIDLSANRALAAALDKLESAVRRANADSFRRSATKRAIRAALAGVVGAATDKVVQKKGAPLLDDAIDDIENAVQRLLSAKTNKIGTRRRAAVAVIEELNSQL